MKEILEAIGWPHVFFLIAIIFIAVFRKRIGGLISRVTSIDKSGVKAEPVPEAQREKDRTEAVQELLTAIGDSIVIRETENLIRNELTGKGLQTEGDTVTVLIKHLAASRILLGFEQIHNLIFGSQIFLLKKLNEVRGQGVTKYQVEAHFAHVQELFEGELGSWTLGEYLDFLLRTLLITNKGETYHLTNLGAEYLTWMIRNGRSENRPL